MTWIIIRANIARLLVYWGVPSRLEWRYRRVVRAINVHRHILHKWDLRKRQDVLIKNRVKDKFRVSC
jgi:hypothetical protein